MARWGGDFAHWDKGAGQIVCDLDLELDALLRTKLAAIDPEAGWFSEETVDSAERLLVPRVWVVDPIDGTRDFVRGRTGWAVSVAMVEGGQATLGVLDAPARREVWTAIAGGGAALNRHTLAVADRTVLAGSRVPADALSAPDDNLVAVERPNSIALRIAMVAGGNADLVASLRWGHEWDIAAAALIASEAGATVTDALGGVLRYNSTKGEMFGVLATPPGIHAVAVAQLDQRARLAAVR